MFSRIVPYVGFLLFSLNLYSQITTEPPLPVVSGNVTISFVSAQDTRLGYFTGDLYAHTGVITEGDPNWKYVIGTWGDNAIQPKLTHQGDGIYELEISPDIITYYSVPEDEKVVQLAFVFRSSDGSRQTHDLFVDVYEEGLAVRLEQPAGNSVVEKGQPVLLLVNASVSSTLKIWLDGSVLDQASGSSLTTSYTFNEAGNHWIIAEASAAGETVRDSAWICVREAVRNEAKPPTYLKGINYPTDTSAALVVWAPGKEYVFVLGDFNNWRPENEFQMKKDGDFFWIEVEGLEKMKEYGFQYFIDNTIRIADPYAEKISDPWNDSWISSDTYPGLMDYPKGKTEGIVSVLQPGQEPYPWEVTDFKPVAKEKMVIYEMLIRDFTEQHTFRSVTEKLDYLEDLHINVLELMPVNEFAGNTSWGYNPTFYFAPDKYYGPKDDLKKLVEECHKRGIAVVLDMVLNHSEGQSPFVQMYMDNWVITPDNPWYNTVHNFQNPDAQWGYDFNHESEATRSLVDSVCSFWMHEYQIDGFRFDFTKGFSNTPYGPSSWGSSYDLPRINNLKRMADQIWKRNEKTIVIFEHLADNSEEKELADHGILLWGNMAHAYGEGAMGYNENNQSDLSWGVYKDRNWTHPNLVTYMESHDEERITYKCLHYGKIDGDYSIKQLPVALDRMELNFVFLVPLPGPKMIWQFGERGYDQSINSFGGRLNEKPPYWNYLEEPNRRDLFATVAKLAFLKQTYEEFTPQVVSYDLDEAVKWMKLNTGKNHVFLVGNFGTREIASTLSFSVMGEWHEYFSGTTLSVDIPPQTLMLAPGEFRLYSTRTFEDPTVSAGFTPDRSPETRVSVYPNPVQGALTVVSETPFQTVELWSVNGEKIFSDSYAGQFRTDIDVAGYPPGLYMLHLKGKNTVTIRKVVIR
jgi:1,4-alpha-glucan branching enzyme